MATNMTIKRYNGSSWVEYAPATTIGQVSGLQTALNGKQATLTFDSAPTVNSTNPVTSGGVYTAISNVQAVASGKTNTYVTKLSNGNFYVGTSSTISTTHPVAIPNSDSTAFEYAEVNTATYSYVYFSQNGTYDSSNAIAIAIADLKDGDIVLVTQTNYPDLWIFKDTSSNKLYFYKLETTKMDLGGYVPTSRTVNGHALTNNITLTASDVSALSSSTTYLASASVSGNTLTITPSSGTAVTYTPTIPTNYLSDTPTSRSDSDSNTTYVIGKGSTSATGTNYYNSKVYFKGNTLYATNLSASNGIDISSGQSPYTTGISNVNGDLYWKTSKVAVGNYIKSASVSNNVLTLTNQSDGTTTLTNNTSFIGSSTPSNAHSGDIWFVTA